MSTDPGLTALLDQADAACRDARLAADPRISEAFTAWFHGELRKRGRAATCPHFESPRVLAVGWLRGSAWLFCNPCADRMHALAGPSDAWVCDRCARQLRRPWRQPVELVAAIGPALAHVQLCSFCALTLHIDPPDVPGELPEGS